MYGHPHSHQQLGPPPPLLGGEHYSSRRGADLYGSSPKARPCRNIHLFCACIRPLITVGGLEHALGLRCMQLDELCLPLECLQSRDCGLSTLADSQSPRRLVCASLSLLMQSFPVPFKSPASPAC